MRTSYVLAAVVVSLLCLFAGSVADAQRPRGKQMEPTAAKMPMNKPLISRPVQIFAADDFNRALIGPNWKVGKKAEGQFKLLQGVLGGQTVQREDADARISAMFPRPCQNLGLTFKIKLGTAATTGIGIGGKPAGNSGYIAAIWFNEKGVQINADAGLLARANKEFPRNEWLEVMLELVGDRVVLQVNGEKIIDEKNTTLAKDTKKHVSFVITYGSAAIDDLMAGEVVPTANQ